MIDPELKIFIPTFLPDGEQSDLFSDLKQLTETGCINNKNFYATYGTQKSAYLDQGDCIDNIPIFDLPDSKSKLSKGFILSNVCDINPDNERPIPSRVLYAPLINLEKYIEKLKDNNGYSEDRIRDIRAQKITSIFYLPPSANIKYESIVVLDNINSLSGEFFSEENIKENRQFQLSRSSWYMLLIKITHHFARSNNSLTLNRSPTHNP